LNGELVPFDCLEFNPELRWIDVMSEVAFVFMDLEDRGYPAFAWRFMNHYLAATGDYDGLRVLRYYLVYRALVRAKVALLRRGEEEEGDPAREALWQEFRGYADLAARELIRRRPALIITHGLSGSGKSTLVAPLAERLGALHVRSDIERKRLFSLAADAKSRSAVDGGIYTADAGRQTYERLHTIAATALEAGCPVLVDATFLERERREQFRKLAADSGAQFLILHCHAPSAVLEERVQRRQRLGADPSEAGLRVLRRQFENQQPLGEDELERSLRIDTGQRIDGEALVNSLLPEIRRRLPGL
ncbi:MAG: AAA family ATPase, partial [Pseudomonadota bacterium]|nr:AAA family ATPase [Pseudomonadota bacterium]